MPEREFDEMRSLPLVSHSFMQIGLITLTYEITSSLLQPLIDLYADESPQPYSLPIGMGFTFFGLLSLSTANHFFALLLSAAL